jgi:hypothetical protein
MPTFPSLLVALAFSAMASWALAQTNAPSATAATAAPKAPSAIELRTLRPGFAGLKPGERVVLMPLDVELFSMSAGGVLEPKADWTANAQRLMREALRERKAKSRLSLTEMSEAQADAFAEEIGLQAAVMQAIATHHFGFIKLPSKAEKLDWSVGPVLNRIAEQSGARYGLFMFVRDSYASAERKAAIVVMALLGVGLTSGVQVGFASLVDLQTGDVLWSNSSASAFGDLREAEPARKSVEEMLAGFPEPR